MPGPLVVVGEARRARLRSRTARPRRRPSRDPSAAAAGAPTGPIEARPRVSVDELQQLQHRLVVLVLVRDQHLVDEAAGEQRLGLVLEVRAGEDVERPLPDLVHVAPQLLAAKQRQLVADPARVLDRVVEAAEGAVERLAAADPLDQPELLEVGDVAEVPGERAEDLREDGVELLLAERLDQHQGAGARVRQARGDRVLVSCLLRDGDADDPTQEILSASFPARAAPRGTAVRCRSPPGCGTPP